MTQLRGRRASASRFVPDVTPLEERALMSFSYVDRDALIDAWGIALDDLNRLTQDPSPEAVTRTFGVEGPAYFAPAGTPAVLIPDLALAPSARVRVKTLTSPTITGPRDLFRSQLRTPAGAQALLGWAPTDGAMLNASFRSIRISTPGENGALVGPGAITLGAPRGGTRTLRLAGLYFDDRNGNHTPDIGEPSQAEFRLIARDNGETISFRADASGLFASPPLRQVPYKLLVNGRQVTPPGVAVGRTKFDRWLTISGRGVEYDNGCVRTWPQHLSLPVFGRDDAVAALPGIAVSVQPLRNDGNASVIAALGEPSVVGTLISVDTATGTVKVTAPRGFRGELVVPCLVMSRIGDTALSRIRVNVQAPASASPGVAASSTVRSARTEFSYR